MKFIPKDEIHAFYSNEPPHMILKSDCVNMFSLNFKLQKRIRQCDPENSKINDCVMKSMRNLHQNNQQDLLQDLTDTSYAGYWKSCGLGQRIKLIQVVSTSKFHDGTRLFLFSLSPWVSAGPQKPQTLTASKTKYEKFGSKI